MIMYAECQTNYLYGVYRIEDEKVDLGVPGLTCERVRGRMGR